VIDIHTHLLPGVDDGAATQAAAVAVLERFKADGVTRVVCTPHLEASQVSRRPLAEHRVRLAALQAAIGPTPELLLGCELMLDAPGLPLTDATAIGLAGTRALLVEFTRYGVPPGGGAELERLVGLGWRPVLAHPERYRGCTVDDVSRWRAAGVVIQTDATLLMGRGPAAELARALLGAGAIDILASDNHGDHRSQRIAVEWLRGLGGAAQAALLTEENPRRLLGGETLAPVPPLRPPGGWLDRLRQLVR
jgi:protein-tyrosine phosphatase